MTAAMRSVSGATLLAGLLAMLSTTGCGEPAEETGASDTLAKRNQGGPAKPGAPRRNVIFVTVDTLRADRLSIYGSSVVETPNFDRLAREGIRFANVSSTVPFTLPAHGSIMTGTYPPTHGVRENVGDRLAESSTTLAEILAGAGYETAGFVSAFVLDARWGIAQGFDHYLDDFDLREFETANLGSVQRPGSETIAAAGAWLDEREEDAARSDRPFFLWLHLFDPHDPYTPPEPYRSRYRHPYDGEVAYTDRLVGGFVDDLERRHLLERSVFVMTGDHGEGLGDHGEVFHGFFVYDSTVHVPLIIRLPGAERAGGVVTEAVSHVDLLPTMLALTGIELPGGVTVQGRSLVPLIDGEGSAAPQPVYAESFYPLLHYGWAPLRAVRSGALDAGGLKYIEAPRAELFDLTTDPGETRNLLEQRAEEAERLSEMLDALAARLGPAAATEASEAELDEEALAQLRALGYVAGGGERATDDDPSLPRPDPKDKIRLHQLLMGASAEIRDGRLDEAALLLKRALALDDGLIDAHQLLGNIALERGQPEAAAAHFEKALALQPEHRPSLFGLATAYRDLGRVDDALVGFRHLAEIAGNDSKVTLAIADLLVEKNDLEGARAALSAAAVDGARPLILARLGEVQALQGNAERARASLERSLELDPKLSQPHFDLAVLNEQLGDLEGAEREYLAAIERAPRHFRAQFNLARLYARLGQPEREIELLEAAVNSKTDFAIGHFYLGKALMDRGDLDRAEEVTRHGLEIGDENPFGWLVLADVLNRQGRRDEARRALSRARDLEAEQG